MKKFLLTAGLVVILAAGGYWLLYGPQVSKAFTASSSSGGAPLTVTFEGSTKDELCSQKLLDVGSVYIIDFGDGQKSDTLKECSDFSEVHTYSKAGIYKSIFTRDSYSLNLLTKSQTVGSATITVSGP